MNVILQRRNKMWKWEIKQDKLVVARGYSEDKETCCVEVFRYADQYSEEDFKRMVVTIERKSR